MAKRKNVRVDPKRRKGKTKRRKGKSIKTPGHQAEAEDKARVSLGEKHEQTNDRGDRSGP